MTLMIRAGDPLYDEYLLELLSGSLQSLRRRIYTGDDQISWDDAAGLVVRWAVFDALYRMHTTYTQNRYRNHPYLPLIRHEMATYRGA